MKRSNPTSRRWLDWARVAAAVLALHGAPAPAQDQPGVYEPPTPPPTEQTPKRTQPPPPAPGDRVLLVFADGRRVEAVLVRDEPAHVVVRIAKVETPVERSMLSAVIVQDSPLTEFRRLRAAIKDTDAERRIDLALWARDHQLYEAARDEVGAVLKLEPQNADARRLAGELEQLIALRDRGGSDQVKSGPDAEPGEHREPPRRPVAGTFPLLTTEQINLLRVYEIDLKNPPKLSIARETIDKLFTRYADNPLVPSSREGREAFRALPPEQVLEVMYRARARDLYPEVRVLDNPASFKFFRDKVNTTWLVTRCASTACHGGSDAGPLLLYNRRPTSDACVYTNFLILDRSKTSAGKPLIDWSEPEKSPLLLLALPPDDSPIPHPKVKGWTPAFRTRDDRRFQEAIEWMKMMYRPRPEYPVSYTPPASGSKAAPGPAGPAPGPR